MKDDAGQFPRREDGHRHQRIRDVAHQGRAGVEDVAHRARHGGHDRFVSPGRPGTAHAQERLDPLVHGPRRRHEPSHPAQFEVCVRVDQAWQQGDVAQFNDRTRRAAGPDLGHKAVADRHPGISQGRAANRQYPTRAIRSHLQ